MKRVYRFLPLIALCLAGPCLQAQSVPGYSWSSFGILPFAGYDFIIVQAPTQYILYYTQVTAAGEVNTNPPGRAFSTDLKTWTVDTRDVCSTSGDLCHFNSNDRSGALTLPNGQIRLFVHNGVGQVPSLSSMISSDGITWTLESGVRLTQDVSDIYEQGNFALAVVSFVWLADGSVRMYYEGGVVPGFAGTPAYYNNPVFYSGMILSARSTDNGLTWVRDPGVRVNPLVQGPVGTVTLPSGVVSDQFSCADVTATETTQNGSPVFRIFCPGGTRTVSYISTDGLSFVLEGQLPADQGDAKAITMPDGRIWLVTNEYPDGIDDTIVYGPQSLVVGNVKAGVTSDTPAGPANPFTSTMIGVTGTATGPVTLQAATAMSTCASALCPFHPEYYSFSPASGVPPFSTLMSYTGPAGYGASEVVVHGTAANVTAVGGVDCMEVPEGGQGANVFCNPSSVVLPMNTMSFAFSSGGAASSQTSEILSLGGHGYPFTTSSSVAWATVSPASGTAPLPITVTVNPAGLSAGTYTGVVTISAETTTEQITVTAVVAPGPVITAVTNAASGSTVIAPNSFVTIYGSGFAASPVVWTPTTSLPTTLGNVQVTINGKSAFISYAGPGQINVLSPPDTATGSVPVVVTTASGTATATATLAPVSPGWFTYTVGTQSWIAALMANTAIYVAPPGSLGGQTSQSARAGEILELFANGLGATTPAPPSGLVLTTAYPVANLSAVQVTIAGLPAPVLFAGLVEAGLYQLNVQVPAGIGVGAVPVVLMVDGQPTQGATLSFTQ